MTLQLADIHQRLIPQNTVAPSNQIFDRLTVGTSRKNRETYELPCRRTDMIGLSVAQKEPRPSAAHTLKRCGGRHGASDPANSGRRRANIARAVGVALYRSYKRGGQLPDARADFAKDTTSVIVAARTHPASHLRTSPVASPFPHGPKQRRPEFVNT
ncbi:hypothetical protein QZM82_32475 [Burkholderia cepacia]|uniref:hypothetical protein n=1 Tax=Burkholderia cepacia TaxID=292 RepID=UPI002651E33F|nr:hypothetical protein [Burkholderia cepacia]MDN7900913.1 hypothetical protein [Burkholderia cepacia]